MKNLLLITCHPYDGSFNAEVARIIESSVNKNHFTVETLDLVADDFNPVMKADDLKGWSKGEFVDPKAKQYFDKLIASDIIAFVFPIWWGEMPAILKGFLDKVLLPGKAYHYNDLGEMAGDLRQKAIVVTTMESALDYFNDVLKNPIEHQFIVNTLEVCGVDTVQYFEIDKIVSSSDDVRTEWLKKIRTYFEQL